jgi:nucleotide-binding universal stress UspA family protein
MIPPRIVLAAIDFSESSRGALAMAARLAHDAGASLHVLHVEDPLLAAAASIRGFDLHGDTKAQLDAFIAETPADILRPDTGGPVGPPVAVHVVAGAAGDVIGDIAVRERADLIVVGARGLGAAEHAIFGSTTENVLRKADVSILVTPDAWTPPRPEAAGLAGMGPVVAAVDFAEPSVSAAAAAAALAGLLHTTLNLVHVVPALPVLERWMVHAEAAIADRVTNATRELESVTRALHSRVPVQTRVLTGDVAEQLAKAAAGSEGRQPLLVLGRRTRADRQGAPGATAYRVLTRAGVAVLVHLPEPSFV